MLEPVANDQSPSVTNWGNIVDSFLDSRSDRRGTTLRDLKTRMRRVLETIAANPKPRDGRLLILQRINLFLKFKTLLQSIILINRSFQNK